MSKIPFHEALFVIKPSVQYPTLSDNSYNTLCIDVQKPIRTCNAAWLLNKVTRTAFWQVDKASVAMAEDTILHCPRIAGICHTCCHSHLVFTDVLFLISHCSGGIDSKGTTTYDVLIWTHWPCWLYIFHTSKNVGKHGIFLMSLLSLRATLFKQIHVQKNTLQCSFCKTWMCRMLLKFS